MSRHRGTKAIRNQQWNRYLVDSREWEVVLRAVLINCCEVDAHSVDFGVFLLTHDWRLTSFISLMNFPSSSRFISLPIDLDFSGE
jgi:hypothetical protein